MNKVTKKRVKKINKNGLINLLGSLINPCPIGITAITAPKVKSDSPYKNLFKIAKVSGFLGNYENMVSKQIQKTLPESCYKQSARTWGKRKSIALVEKVDKDTGEIKYYLSIKVRKNLPYYFVMPKSGKNKGLIKNISQEKVNPYLPNGGAVKGALGTNVIERAYSLDNIKRVSIGGITYKVI